MQNKKLSVLEVLNNNKALSQRDIAKITNLSVGTINSIIKQLIDENLIYVRKLSRKTEYELAENGVILLEKNIKQNMTKKVVFPSNENVPIKQAVLLAAGEQLDFDKPVGFLPLGEMTVVERMIEMLIECGIEEIIIIAGYENQYYEELAKENKHLIVINNHEYRWNGTMASLAYAEEYIKDDFLLIESDIVVEKRALEAVLENENRNCLLITNESGSEDEVFVEIRNDFIFKMSKDRHQFSKIDGELIGISKISKNIFEKMLEEFQSNKNPLYNYEYALLDVGRTFNIGYVKIEDLIWSEVDTRWHYKNLINYIFPRLKAIENSGKVEV